MSFNQWARANALHANYVTFQGEETRHSYGENAIIVARVDRMQLIAVSGMRTASIVGKKEAYPSGLQVCHKEKYAK